MHSQPARHPWVSGTFYLFAVIVLAATALAAARIVSITLVPIVLLFALLAVSFVGALQLRQDQRLGETNFLKLMLQSLKALPMLRRKTEK